MGRSKKSSQAKNQNSTTTSTTAPIETEEQVTVKDQDSTLASDESKKDEVKEAPKTSNDESKSEEKSSDSSDKQDSLKDEQEADKSSSEEEKSTTDDKKESQENETKKESEDKSSDSSSKESEDNKSDSNNKDTKEPAPKVAAKATKKKETTRLANSEDTPINDAFKAHVIVVTSGKGGVGKTTTAASISTGLALKGHKTVVIDFDIGLRNLDLIMGCERRVVYDIINVLHGEAKLHQALIKDKHTDGQLAILAASQTKDKDSLSYEGVGKILKELSDMGYEYIICDSPAGIEAGALIALYYADEAIITTNPEISSIRDSDRILGILDAKSRRAINNWDPVTCKLLLTRYSPDRVAKKEMMSLPDIQDFLKIPLLGVIPESADVLNSSNNGNPIILNKESDAGMSYQDVVERLLGNEVPLRFIKVEKSFLQKIFGK